MTGVQTCALPISGGKSQPEADLGPGREPGGVRDRQRRATEGPLPHAGDVPVTGPANLAQLGVADPDPHDSAPTTAVGRKIALAAAANLTPVTLELGGKSPALVHAGADLAITAPRLAAGKLLNAGQTCIAPDYILVPEDIRDRFVGLIHEAVTRLYPSMKIFSQPFSRR